jgi:PPOX class probable F420-dependent enzyme
LIRLTDDEVHTFLAEHRTAQVATIGADGMPHLVAMWYGLIDRQIVMWTYAKSQKARNLRRTSKLALLVEAGQRYDELRGVSITGTAELSDDREYVLRVGAAVLFGPHGGQELDPFGQEILNQSAAKRVAITVTPAKVVSWDHRKLGGRY